MSCNPEQDQFIWPLEISNIIRPDDEDTYDGEVNRREEWALPDYVNPDEDYNENVTHEYVTKHTEKVEAITKIRYFLSEEQANGFIDSCWLGKKSFFVFFL